MCFEGKFWRHGAYDQPRLPPSAQAHGRVARGLKAEILNGRAAMLGLMGFLSASSVPGSVPFLAGIEGFPKYAGDVMAPFSGDFTLGLAN